MINLAVLGATGSIGVQTLEVAAECGYNITLLSAYKNADFMIKLSKKYHPLYVVMADQQAALQVKEALVGLNISVYSTLEDLCNIITSEQIDIVMSSIMGIAGLRPTYAAILAGKKILLANKESLITSGTLFMQAAVDHQASILPVDSEHSAIFQSLPLAVQENLGFCDLAANHISKIILTGSGGPFLTRDLNTFQDITVQDALKHPNWSMGAKITIDSSTMMNKGFEYIEAAHLFNATQEQMDIVIHPESIIHSMVEYQDGSVIAQLGNPDMKVPISHALTYPHRKYFNQEKLNFFGKTLTFHAVDYAKFPCLKLAIDSHSMGQYATIALNAANEIAVAAFLAQKIKYVDIFKINQRTVEQTPYQSIDTIEDVFNLDTVARTMAQNIVGKL